MRLCHIGKKDNGETPQPIKILKIDDQTLNVTEVHVLVNFATGGVWQGERIIPLRFIYETTDGTTAIRGDEKGDWFLMKLSLTPKDYKKKTLL